MKHQYLIHQLRIILYGCCIGVERITIKYILNDAQWSSTKSLQQTIQQF